LPAERPPTLKVGRLPIIVRNPALRDGESTITWPHVYFNKRGEEVHSRCEIDFTGARDGRGITQQNCGSGKVRPIRIIELMAPNMAKSPQQVLPLMAESLVTCIRRLSAAFGVQPASGVCSRQSAFSQHPREFGACCLGLGSHFRDFRVTVATACYH